MAILGVHHCSFTVTDLDQTIRFYRDLLGMKLLGRKRRAAPDLGTALLGPDNAPGSENDASGEARDQAVRLRIHRPVNRITDGHNLG
ncbi:MAG: VOC family protein, partial [Thermoleophilia bacterium]|nr:VOC family protein [Thermoleophilia bacterium]